MSPTDPTPPLAGSSPVAPTADAAVNSLVARISALRADVAALTDAQRAALEAQISAQFGLHVDSLMHGEGFHVGP